MEVVFGAIEKIAARKATLEDDFLLECFCVQKKVKTDMRSLGTFWGNV